MKAAVVVPAENSRWQITDVPQPQPETGQVLVKMHASGMCYTDVHETLGNISSHSRSRAGRRDRGCGSRRHDAEIGDRVGTAWIQSTCRRCEWCQRGRRMFCASQKATGIEVQGGNAEYMLMNADATYLIPENVPYEQAAPMFCAGYTVYSGLRWADPKPHDRVAVLGIGGLGHLAVQYAKAAGLRPSPSRTPPIRTR